jgi:hypothetical protein
MQRPATGEQYDGVPRDVASGSGGVAVMAQHLHLNLFIHARGHHEAAWRHPAASPLPLTDIRYYTDLARKAEAGLFDSIFLADTLGVGEDVTRAPRIWLGHLADRADRHLLHHLYRAVQPGAEVCVAGPYQRRPGRLEHRHHVAGNGVRQLRRRGAAVARRPLREGRRIHAGGDRAVGQLVG